MKNKVLFALFAIPVLFCSCSAEADKEIIVSEIPPGPWSEASPVYIYYENADTLNGKELSALIRFRNNFPYDRLNFVIETRTPDSLVWRDTLSVSIRKNATIETNSMGYTDTKANYRSESSLKRPGIYSFLFAPVAPSPIVDQVIGVGLEITTN